MKYKVIVADDEDVIRKGIVYLIDWDKLNCEIVQECTDGLQVLKYLEKNTADIVITDIKMPKLSGIELMEEIDKKHKGLKMILVTAYTDFEFARKALRYGAVDFVVKNDIITDLPKAVKKAVWQYETEKKERERPQAGPGQRRLPEQAAAFLRLRGRRRQNLMVPLSMPSKISWKVDFFDSFR